MRPALPRELNLHIQVANLLTQYLADGWEFTHPASGEYRDKRTAARLKRMGTKPGWPDLILLSPTAVFHGLELKRKGGSLSSAQRDFHRRAIGKGWNVTQADSFDAALAILERWGCLRVTLLKSYAGVPHAEA
ncbi:VRR-NUC domain-containing protein [Microvirga antarctica]|uniref:VRR-NUC domain-containing protein n=1 Tax=Microvirga antarctica TaxID=2819233 RepID=UPI001B312FD3|nr:VRR-NUC domain-containing protein [Microvirga antarctica]